MPCRSARCRRGTKYAIYYHYYYYYCSNYNLIVPCNSGIHSSSHYMYIFDRRGAFAIVSYKVDRPYIRLNSPDVKAGGHVIQGRWPFVSSRDGMERRKGDTIRRLRVRPPDVAMVKVRMTTKRRRDIDVDGRLTRRLFVYTIDPSGGPCCWRSKFELDHTCRQQQ